MNVHDYVKQKITAQELVDRQYWAVRQFGDRHSWIGEAVRKIHEQSESAVDELRDTLREAGDPTFAQPLHRYYLRLRAEEVKAGASAEGVPARPDARAPKAWPPLRPAVNTDYGRLGYLPLEQGGAGRRRVPYAQQRRVGYWNESGDKKKP